MDSSESRLAAMFAGWLMALCGVHRRDWPGTITAMIGLGLAAGAVTIGEGKQR